MLYRTFSILQGRNLNWHAAGLLRPAAKRAGFIVLSVVVTVTVLAVSLAGCDTAVSTRTEPEPKPTLLGTWERTTVDTHDDGTVEKQTVIITDTHFIQRDVRLDANGDETDSGGHAGTVSIAESSVTVTRFAYDGETDPVEKAYLLVDDVLFVHHWESEEPEVNYDRFTRVGDPPTPGAATLPLQGTWQTTDNQVNEEYGDIFLSEALTFTASRAVRARAVYDTSGQLVTVWTDPDGWSISGTTITKMFFEDDDDTVRSVDKEYIIAGDLLAIHDWWEEESTHEFTVWQRNDNPLPAGLTGLWAQDYEDEDRAWRVEMTVGSDGSFRRLFTLHRGDDPTREHDVTGTYELDADEKFILVTIASTVRNGEPATAPGWQAGESLRFAYAPTTNPDLIVMSIPWWEQSYDVDAGMWVDRPENRFGRYWDRLTRVE